MPTRLARGELDGHCSELTTPALSNIFTDGMPTEKDDDSAMFVAELETFHVSEGGGTCEVVGLWADSSLVHPVFVLRELTQKTRSHFQVGPPRVEKLQCL